MLRVAIGDDGEHENDEKDYDKDNNDDDDILQLLPKPLFFHLK